MRNLGNRLSIVTALLLLSSSALAGLVIENEPPPPAPQIERIKPTLTQKGQAIEVTRVKRDIKAVEFTKALKQIVPPAWKGFADSESGIRDVGAISVVAANRPWTEVLEEVLKENGFTAAIDWDAKEVSFKPN